MRPRAILSAFLPTFLLLAGPVGAQQQSESYRFLQAVKDAKGNEVVAIVDRPGSTVINTRDQASGEGALHIVAKRGDEPYLRYLLGKGADANMRDRAGNTPLLVAVGAGQAGLIPAFVAGRANVNLGNGAGETPLIRAVQRRDLAMARALLTAGADPDQTDNVAGMSARDYARRDARNPALLKLLEDAPKTARRAVSGPKL